jgi:hypothetical protein
MALAIEPMITLGSEQTIELADEWTVVTADASRAAHFEHTVAITPEGPWVLTAEDGGAGRLSLARDSSAERTMPAADTQPAVAEATPAGSPLTTGGDS